MSEQARCEVAACERPAASGMRYCERHYCTGWRTAGPNGDWPCLVRACPAAVEFPHWGLCGDHRASFNASPGGVDLRRWLASLSSPAPTPSHRCEVEACPRDAHPGARYCMFSTHEAGPLCYVRGCPERRAVSRLACAAHCAEWQAAPGLSFPGWLEARAPATGGAPVSPQTQAPRCAECENEAAPGSRFCREGDCGGNSSRCWVRGCEVLAVFGGALCEGHGEERDSSGVGSVWRWLATRPAPPASPVTPPPLPVPSHITTHGAPAGEDAETLGEALRQGTREGLGSDLGGLAAREAQGGRRSACGDPSLLSGQCMAWNCSNNRTPGSAFCQNHEHEGQAALHAEFMDALPPEEREAEEQEIERLVSVGQRIVGDLLGRHRPCVNAQCPEGGAPRAPGSAFCAGCRP